MSESLQKQLDEIAKFLQECVERINQAVKKLVAYLRKVVIAAHAKAGHPICPQCLHALVKFDGFSFFVQNPGQPIDAPGNAKKLAFTGLRCPRCEGIVHNGKFHPGTKAEQVFLSHGTHRSGKSSILSQMMIDYMTSHQGAYVTLLSRKQFLAQHGTDAPSQPISGKSTEPPGAGLWAYRNFPDDFPWKEDNEDDV